MDRNHETILENAQQEVDYVKDYLDDLAAEEETRKLWRAWFGVLTHYVNAVSALRRATSCGASKGWSDNLKNEQKQDEWLRFAFQARDAANHVFESKRHTEPRRASVGVISMSNAAHVHISDYTELDHEGNVVTRYSGALDVADGRYTHGTFPRDKVEEHEHQLVLTEVKTRSGTYAPPKTESTGTQQAIEIGNYLLDWLRQKLFEAQNLAEQDRKKNR
ncbi:hypothetical protein [Thalassococcus sp. S3]|uniref:hypothetical protein n=1 Tax=Thalassococcus sp. S3 TaxID=2017482 RepID=UPI0010247568|nr:hypothetical protein [Thalassococcus sp. S3]QBF32170.1 hypothetical protein CFI11_13210 [Thalassococcus sp. S3]